MVSAQIPSSVGLQGVAGLSGRNSVTGEGGSGVGPGWGWDGTNFVAPPQPDPVPNPALDQPGSPPDVIQ